MVRYDYGLEKRIYLNNLTEQEVDSAVEELKNNVKKNTNVFYFHTVSKVYERDLGLSRYSTNFTAHLIYI